MHVKEDFLAGRNNNDFYFSTQKKKKKKEGIFFTIDGVKLKIFPPDIVDWFPRSQGFHLPNYPYIVVVKIQRPFSQKTYKTKSSH